LSDPTPPNGSRAKIAAILVLAALVAGSLWLAQRLGGASAIQDCVATGRHDCGS